jgi:hypothetical protein
LSVTVFVGTRNGHYDALQPVEAKGRIVILDEVYCCRQPVPENISFGQKHCLVHINYPVKFYVSI